MSLRVLLATGVRVRSRMLAGADRTVRPGAP